MAQETSTFRSILVPLDGSSFAEEAVPLASRIARGAGGKLRLMLVHELPPAPLDLATEKLYTSIELATRKSERGYLRGIQAKLRDDGVRVLSAVTLTGPVGPALARYVRETGIDLVVMATHGRGGIRRAWLGSVADHLIRNLEVPVLLVRPKEDKAAPAHRPGVGEILVPLDGSPLAEEALEPAAALARIWDAPLTLLQVVRPVLLSTDPGLPLPSSYNDELTALWRSQAQDYLDDLVERMKEQGLRAAGVAVIGWGAVDSILDAARPETVDSIVIATHGRGGLRRLALGSVADKVIRGADVPVMVCRPRRGGKTKKQSRRRASARPAKAGR